MTRVDGYVSPVEPIARAYYLQANVNNGHDLFRGPSDIEATYIFTGPDDAPPLIKPPPLTLRRTRPSGWTPPIALIGLVGVVAAVLGAVAR